MPPSPVSPAPLNPDLLGLLASCRAAPADDTPRLVLADWLEEHAEVSGLPSPADARARAALVRVQVELARPTSDIGRTAELRAEERALLAAHAERWLGDLPRRLHELAHPRFGFAQHLATNPPRPFAFDPLAVGNPARFVRGLIVARIGINDLNDPELGAWFRSPLAAWTEEVSTELVGAAVLERLPVGADLRRYLGVHYLAGAAEFPTLRNVRPTNEETTERQARRLLACANFGLVRRLSVFAPALEVGFLRVMAGADVSNVRQLIIKGPLSDTGAAFLASAALVNLSALDASGTELTAEGLRRIARAPHLRQLVALSAFRNRFGCEGAAALAGSPLAHTLNVLDLQNTGIGHRGAAALADSPLLGRLHGPQLNLSMNPLGSAGVRALAGCEHLARFTELVLRDCGAADAGARALATSPHVANLEYLDLWKNGIGDPGARALAGSRHLGAVRDLSLRDNRITPAGERRLRTTFAARVKV
ncbi:MAG TPA: TIGR02996 domain-containing protein [Gemmata sp.]